MPKRPGVHRPCPPWCQEPAGHLKPNVGGPGDYHTATVTSIILPEISGLRGASGYPLQVTVEQYVTTSDSYQPMVAVDLGHSGELSGHESLTPQEARQLAEALVRGADITEATPPAR
jgi:hypothetical protein